MSLSFWEITERAISSGSKMEIREFDLKLYYKIKELIEKYKIEYHKDRIIETDDDLLDRIFQSGRELYLETGSYCLDTKRTIKFSEHEVDNATGSLTGIILLGSGSEQRLVKHRKPEDLTAPFIQGGFIGGNATEEMYVPFYQSAVQEPQVDSVYFDPPAKISGYQVVHNTPLELMAAKMASMKIHEALARAGRPGMHLLGGAGSAAADICTCHPTLGIRRTDGICAHTTSELKTDMDALNKIGHSLQYGCMRQVWWAPVIGGFAAGPVGSAIVGVAGLYHNLLIGMGKLSSAYLDLQVTPHYAAGASDNLCLWISSTTGQAITRNCKAILQGTVTTSAGPGTEMMLREIAASTIAITVSGMHLFGVRIQKPQTENHGSGMESAWMGEVANAAVNLEREKADKIVWKLFDSYRGAHRNAPGGKPFSELYDLKTIQPKNEYYRIYKKVKKDLSKMGLKFNE